MNIIETIGEGVTITPQISTSLNGSSFTNLEAGASNVLGLNFRYVKVIFTLSASGNNDLIQFHLYFLMELHILELIL